MGIWWDISKSYTICYYVLEDSLHDSRTIVVRCARTTLSSLAFTGKDIENKTVCKHGTLGAPISLSRAMRLSTCLLDGMVSPTVGEAKAKATLLCILCFFDPRALISEIEQHWPMKIDASMPAEIIPKSICAMQSEIW